MVHDEEIDAGGHGLAKGHHAGIDGGADAGHAPVVGELQAVAGAGRILEGGPPGALVAVGDKVG